jgi:hypothetical protein
MSNPNPYNALIASINTKLGNLHSIDITSAQAAKVAKTNASIAANAAANAAKAAKMAENLRRPFLNVRTGGRRTKRHIKKHRKSKQSRRALRSSKTQKGGVNNNNLNLGNERKIKKSNIKGRAYCLQHYLHNSKGFKECMEEGML